MISRTAGEKFVLVLRVKRFGINIVYAKNPGETSLLLTLGLQ